MYYKVASSYIVPPVTAKIESNQSGRVKNLHSFVCTQHCSLTACIEKKEGMEGVARNIVFLYFVIKENAEVM